MHETIEKAVITVVTRTGSLDYRTRPRLPKDIIKCYPSDTKMVHTISSKYCSIELFLVLFMTATSRTNLEIHAAFEMSAFMFSSDADPFHFSLQTIRKLYV